MNLTRKPDSSVGDMVADMSSLDRATALVFCPDCSPRPGREVPVRAYERGLGQYQCWRCGRTDLEPVEVQPLVPRQVEGAGELVALTPSEVAELRAED